MQKYRIYCLKDPDTLAIRYVGVTTKQLNVRLAQHYYSGQKCKMGTKVSKWIYKLRKNNKRPIIELIEIVNSSSWEEREKFWIFQYSNLLNQREGGKGVVVDRSVTSIQRSAKAHYKRIVQLSWEGKLVNIWLSVKQASQRLKILETAISNVLNKRSKRANGFRWFYLDDYINGNYKLPLRKSNKDYSKLKPVYQYDITGKLIAEYLCKNQAIKTLINYKSYKGINRALAKKTLFKGYYFSYKNNEIFSV